MNIEDYISTGILEAYVVGELSDAERAEVEKNISSSPELQEELQKVEATLEAFAQKAALTPRAALKAKVMNKVLGSDAKEKEVKVVALSPATNYWKYAAAASIAFAILTSVLAVNYRQRWVETQFNLNNLIAQNQQMAQDYNKVNFQLDKIQEDFSVIENTAFTKVVMKGTPNEPEALASVYWNASTQEVFISIQALKEISQENQFQLWAIVDGKPVDAGVFDASFDGLFKMKNVQGAVAFAVTVEPRGGKPSPTLETMRVMGQVVRG